MYKPTLLIPRGLGFPGGRFQRGFDSSHVAARGIKAGHGISAVAARTTFLNLLNGKKGQFGGGTPRQDGIIGPVFDGVASNDGFNTGNAAITDDNVVMACIIRAVTCGSSASHFLETADGGSGWGLDTLAAGTVQLTNNGNGAGHYIFTRGLTNGAPYFIAASGSGTANIGNLVIVNLATGQIQSETRGAVTAASSSNASNGNYGFCSLAGTGSANAYMAAGMWGPSLLTLPQLLAWAEDPWSFWYPRPAPLEIFTDQLAAAAAAAGPGLVAPSIFRPGQGPTRGLSTRRSTDIPAAGGTTASGDGASAGVATVQAVGAALFAGQGASAGVGTATGVGAGLDAATAASAGIGAAQAVGASLFSAVAASAGTGAATGVGSFTVPSNVGTSAGIGTATGIGAWTADSIAASAGAGTALGVGQASGLISAVGSSAGISIVLGVSPAVEQPAGGAGYVMRSHSFTRKRWEELQALIAAEKAAAAKAEKVGNPARAEALAEAAGKAADAIAALGAVEEQDAYSADMARLAGLLEGATKAKKAADSIREAKEAALLAEKLQAEADEEYEIMLLLDDGPEAAREMERIVAMMAAITGGR